MPATTFTDADAATLAALQAKQAQANYEQAEADRKAKYAALKPVADALGTDAAMRAQIAALSAAKDAATDLDVAQRLDRMVLILTNDGLALISQVTALASSLPAPVVPSATPTPPAGDTPATK